MNTNQSFIGAYARNRHRSDATNDVASANQRVPAPHVPPVPTKPATTPQATIAPEPVSASEPVTIEHAVSVSNAVAESTEVWVNEIAGQVLRVDHGFLPLRCWLERNDMETGYHDGSQ